MSAAAHYAPRRTEAERLDNLVLLCRHHHHSADVSAETSKARWYAGEQMEMEHAVWLLPNVRHICVFLIIVFPAVTLADVAEPDVQEIETTYEAWV